MLTKSKLAIVRCIIFLQV